MKLKTRDGKYRLTDVVDIEGMFKIIEYIPILANLSKETIKRLVQKHRPQGLKQNKDIARMCVHAAKVKIEDIDRNL